jgi:mannose-6-phosphate isomerase
MQPELLRPDNFTPPTRTPWGGRNIAGRYKRDLGLPPESQQASVGESWEVSVEPSFPSVLARTGETLAQAIAREPVGWLGPEVSRRFAGQTPLLVKVVDAASPLSVQVHPPDGHASLAPDESGKPEAWIVLETEPDAGLFLGFREGVGRESVAACLQQGGALDQLMNFVSVAAGDAFLIRPGTPHAIGPGVTIYEPQNVEPGKRGVTYRFWDWNRLYDAQGRPSPGGKPRLLHVAESLDVTDWGAPRGPAFVEWCRVAPRPLSAPGDALRHAALLDTPHFAVEQWLGSGHSSLSNVRTMLAFTCLGGRAEIRTPLGSCVVPCGQSAVVPAAAGALELVLENATLFASRTT